MDAKSEFRKRIESILEYYDFDGYDGEGYNVGQVIRDDKLTAFWDIFRAARDEFPFAEKEYTGLAMQRRRWFAYWFGEREHV